MNNYIHEVLFFGSMVFSVWVVYILVSNCFQGHSLNVEVHRAFMLLLVSAKSEISKPQRKFKDVTYWDLIHANLPAINGLIDEGYVIASEYREKKTYNIRVCLVLYG